VIGAERSAVLEWFGLESLPEFSPPFSNCNPIDSHSSLQEEMMALYLVIGEYVDPGALLPPQGVVQVVEQAVLPSFEALAKLQEQKKIVAGGIYSGDRKGALILDVADNDEASRVMMSLPFWGLVKWTLTPLQSFRERASDEARMIAQLKATLR
jgi:hypothetical protein